MEATFDTTNLAPVPLNAAINPPIPQATSDVLDWDIQIETPPQRPHGKIEVQLAHGGRSRPIPINESDTD